MRNIYRIFNIVVYFLAGILLVSSCRKDEAPVYDHFISTEITASYPVSTINYLLDYASLQYPEINDIKPYITFDVNVFNMVYSTTIDNMEIRASGLVCIPATEGEYPVLSYQNGTNTLNSNAPSENPTNINYQLIEFVSSMGFIVVIPDYPGFGESADIPHPYLVAEPTTRSAVDMFRAVKEGCPGKFQGVSAKNEYYLMGYSQGGWATLSLHKALEVDYPGEFNLAGSVCGAGPYNIYNLFQGILDTSAYPMPSYLGYIISAWSVYHQFTNPVSDLLNEQYATKLGSLYNGTLSLSQINSQLTTSIPGLFKADFISGFSSSPAYTSVRSACITNSISAWHSTKPLMFVHGTGDTQVSVKASELMYKAMIESGTSGETCMKVLFSDLDHADALLPGMITGLNFLLDIRDNR